MESADGADVETYAATYAGKKTEEAIEKSQKDFYQALSSEGISYDKVYSYKNIDNAVAIEIDTSFVSDIKEMDGVESVVICDTYSKPQAEETTSSATTNATSVYATGIYDSSDYVEQYGGKGMSVAILDTGLDYTHEAFQLTDDPDDYYYEYSQTFHANMRWTEDDIDAYMSAGTLNASGSVYVSDKVPFAFDYSDNDADVYPSYSNHGTHVAGIIAGRAASYSDSDGNIVYKDGYDEDSVVYKDGYDYMFTDSTYSELATEEFIGVAPYAQLVICKVFTDDLDDEDVGGATTEDILAALEDCITLGVDVINMSLGSTNGFSTTDDGDDEGEYMNTIYNAIGDAGISLVVAASNDYSSGYGSTFGTNLASNPDSGTVGSPSTYSSAISVASISGKMSNYLLSDGGTSVFFRESADENSVDYDFIEQMLELAEDNDYYDEDTGVLKICYVVIPGVGQSTDYTSTIKRYISSAQSQGYLTVALVKRGTTTFQDKVENAMTAGADAVIVYNNVAGEIKMTIGDIEDPVPAISITQEAGTALVNEATNYVGYLYISKDYEAGPFMSDFSSWGVTSDLKLKPEITAHGGEITSSVPGGYTEMSGTSMATPNVSGLMANILSYIKQNYSTFFTGEYNQANATQLAYQLMMSTATIVYDEDGLAYSPRKQGAGLASLDNLVSSLAYLSTDSTETITESAHGTYTGADSNRPKVELGEDENKVGEYTIVYYFNNVSGGNMSFTLESLFFTESLSLDGMAVAQQAYMLEGNAVWTINGATYSDGDTVTFGTGTTRITCTLTLTDAEKQYLDESFVNGMFIEGFLQLISQEDGQCDLSIPFMGFYGDWESAPMLDYSEYELAEIEADTSIDDDEKPSETVWATQAYTMYWNGTYVLPMGSFLYNQDEDADQIYASEEYASVSCYNDETAGSYNDDTASDARSDSSSYMTSYAIKGLYAGLLRNAKYVTVTMTDATTGEVIYTKEVYRVGKAYAGGGSASPAYVKLELTPDELGLVENGTYRMEFNFFFQSKDEEITEDNTYSFSFTVDYTAPVLEDVQIRYVDYKDTNGNAQQRVYLDLSVYDNHYAMAALLCYYSTNSAGENELILATDYVTPIYNAVKNGTSTVTIEITDLMSLIEDGLTLYVELDDYALNHSIYALNVNTATSSVLPDTFTVNESTNSSGNYAITLGKLETYTVSLGWDTTTYSSANLSNFTWKIVSGSQYLAVKNGQLVGLKAGTAVLQVSGGSVAYNIYVTVTDNTNKISSYPSISFGTIYNSADVPVEASGTVSVNIEQQIQLEIEYDPWYYDLVSSDDIDDKVAVSFIWESTDPSVAEVDQDGNVTFKKKGSATVTARISGTAYSATVTFSVQEAFTVSSTSLTGYTGSGGVVYIPTDMNITTIGEEAFKNNTDITAVIIPKTVTSIGEEAFYGCTNLKYVFFYDVYTQDVADCELTLIYAWAFAGCTSLEYVDFSNCKTFTIAKYAFEGCTSLTVIKGIENIGTAHNYAFYGCTSLVGSLSSDSGVELVKSVVYNDGTATTDLDGIANLVKNTSATDIRNVKITLSETLTEADSACVVNIMSMKELCSYVTSLDITGLHVSGNYVFANCDSLTVIDTAEFTSLGSGMFYDCDGITSVTIKTATVGSYAFYNCDNLASVAFEGITNGTIGAYAFASDNANNLASVTFGEGVTIKSIGDKAFANSWITSFTLPEGLASLGDDLFSGGSLKTLEITTDISQISFTGTTFNSIKTITLNDAVEALVIENNILYNKDKTKVILALNDTAGNKVTSYEIASTVTEIGSYAFSDKSITSITIPEGVTTIGDYAFSGSSLTSVVIPASVKTLGSGAFSGCTSLASVTFESGSALTDVGSYAFMSTAVTAVEIPSTVTTVGSYAFADTPITAFTYAPAGEATFGSYVFAGCTKLESLTLADNITTMGDGTFYGCTSLKTVTLPSVKELGWLTFYGATNIESVVFGENAETTGDYTFYTVGSSGYTVAYNSLTSVTLGGKTTEIGTMAFVYCTALTSVDLSNIKTVGQYAFWNNTSLASVTGLGNVKTIGAYAFYNCPLATVDISSAKTIGNFAFYGNAATTITIPATLESTTTETVSKVDGAAYDITITESYEYTYASLGYGAFAGAASLTSFKVEDGNTSYFTDDSGVLYRTLSDGSYELMAYPSALTGTSYTVIDGTVRVDAYAFADLTAGTLASVTLPYELATIGIGAFNNSGISTYNFTSVTAPTLEAEVSYDSDSESDDYYYYMTYLSSVAGGIYRGLYNTNFEDSLINYADDIVYVYSVNGTTGNTYSTTSTLKMTYPSNGTGYTNYVFSKYFGSSSTTEAVLSTASYTVYKNLSLSLTEGSGWYSVSTINGWATAEVTDELTEIVTEFSDLVKTTHLNYNNMKSDSTQVTLLNAKLAEYGISTDLLSETEEALSQVKSRFGITVKFSSAEVSSDYKSTYTVGEYFDMTGLEITVTYDDYSEQVYTYADGELELVAAYATALETIDNVVYVRITELSRTVGLRITVTESTSGGSSSGSEGSSSSSGSSSSGCSSSTIGGSIGGIAGLVIAAVAVVAITLIKNKKAKENYTDGSDGNPSGDSGDDE